MKSVEVMHERDHYEVYIDGMFYCSADTVSEAVYEIEKYYEAEVKQ